MANNTASDAKKQKLITLLYELFQLDKPELDFGLYKIMHAKSEQISAFLENDLLKKIQQAFGEKDEVDTQTLKNQAQAKLKEALGDEALDEQGQLSEVYASTPAGKRYLDEMATAEATKETLTAEAEIYDHLYRFFERYYDNGDFMSRRYYARESDSRAAPFSVPYDGREVYLHWANKDQYYIKSSEYLTNYTFELNEAIRQEAQAQKQSNDKGDALNFDEGVTDQLQKVHMRIVSASEGEHGNIKASNDQKRFFIIHDEPVILENGELVIQFQYRADSSKSGQDKKWQDSRLDEAESAIIKALNTHDEGKAFLKALQLKAPTDSQKNRTLLGKHLQKYSARNTMDYFIHKDLGGFLRRELDFYIKNEIMRLDDLENAEVPKVEQYLSKICVLRRIAHQLIAFLAQLEDFQKKLWLKKKFVTETQYCITLDRIPESFYPEIAANEKQRQEWVSLFAINEIEADLTTPGYSEPLTVDFLKANLMLVIDTALFNGSFRDRIISEISLFDDEINGVLLHCDNFQGLNFSDKKYARQVKFTYIDPPYNTGSDDFIYKDQYQSSSWLSFIMGRVDASLPILSEKYNYVSSIDDDESANLKLLLEEVFDADKFVSDISYERSGSSGLGQGGKIVNTKEHILVFSSDKSALNDIQYERNVEYETLKRYNKILSDIGDRNEVGSFVAPSTGEDVRIFKHSNFNIDTISLRDYQDRKDEINDQYVGNFENVFRLTSVQKENEFQNKILAYCKDGLFSADYLVSRGRFAGKNMTLFYFNGQILVWLKDSAKCNGKIIVKGNKITDHWSHGEIPKADLANEGGVTLSRGKKPEQLIKRLIDWCSNEGDLVLDYFSGSGTTAAVATKSNRKFLAIDSEKYFDDKSLRRIKNVLHGDRSGISRLVNWKGGGCFKYLRLESYEDSLNNLTLKQDPNRDLSLSKNSGLHRDYLLNYFLNVETENSQSLLNIADFRDPTAYKMWIKKPGSDEQTLQNIDLIETFNWLLGLWVVHLAAPQTFSADFSREKDKDLPEDNQSRLVCNRLKTDQQGDYWFRLIEGYTLKIPGEDSSKVSTLIVWRKLTDDPEKDNAALQKYLETIGISTREKTYDVIYVNGSHTLPNPVVEGEQTKVRLIEDAFHQAMWSEA